MFCFSLKSFPLKLKAYYVGLQRSITKENKAKCEKIAHPNGYPSFELCRTLFSKTFEPKEAILPALFLSSIPEAEPIK
jgi:hypothetical protein